MNLSNEKVFKRLLEQDSKLRDLVTKAGLQNNPQRVQELNGCIAVNGGSDVIKSKEEKELAIYLFCADFDSTKTETAVKGRIIAANEAGIDDL